MLRAESNKKIVLISYTFVPNSSFRATATWNIIRAKFPNSHFIYANWNHLTKEKIASQPEKNVSPLNVPTYSKNLSLSRVASHLAFSFKLLFSKEFRGADVLFCSIPPNMTLIPAIIQRVFSPKTKIICDIVDLWPEAIPLDGMKKKIFEIISFFLWVIPRNFAYKTTDIFISHCEYFLQQIGPAFLPEKTFHLPLCLTDLKTQSLPSLSIENELRFLLLGSVNNIFDQNKCVTFFKELTTRSPKKIVLEIVGLGETLGELLAQLQEAPKLEVKNHGAVFDRDQKDIIMSRIHFGLNLYKDTTAIGVSYKSIEYMAHGIPLINSAQGDLLQLISKHSIGYNMISDVSETVENIINIQSFKYELMRRKTHTLYKDLFSSEAFERKLLRILEDTA